MKRLAVFCGSSNGATEAYKEGAVQLGKQLAERNITLVYGGASVGMMGTVADTVLKEGGNVIGVIPKLLEEREIAHQHLTELHTVNTMHERKAKMADLADGFIALPGGPGTLEEFFEIFTWAQIGLHKKPLGLLNINNYYHPLIHMLDHMVEQQFLQEKYRSLAILDSNPKTLIDKFSIYEPPAVKSYMK
ncbi:TIGR00730 family Rossman fold protein [Bacillus aquiflavi]|uniref:Cytokinin riboside 5'-monophosphate phosphoribohydrolase n=1 Tax=Bacillus aquiflavi TaxID=2672567 RepID=A0A6B3VRE0_9BACI|nr:TIGR00730 family Rossman fold protein [Bacillus aquiflavi]MBA4536176.1 TIGR00730 family Rossman fold protein [Bacillus aquiflavi]NEY80549.1 TIGR00730 family Rossman fold protein [Bacillus aquiflavi]UAC46987.1 TIGR00730 family Rossman fold protein [Bacillus aquiflavi]